MATYKPFVTPTRATLRAAVLDALTRAGATIYRTDNGEVEARNGWGDLGDGMPVPSPRPPSWVVVAAPAP